MRKLFNRNNPHQTLLLVAIAILTIVIAPALFSEGMFMDGLIYTTVAKNMANGIGSFWTPHFSTFKMSEFYEHPPLVMGIESAFFRLFGDHFITERIFCLVVLIATVFIMKSVWRKINGSLDNFWLVTFLYATIGTVGWAFPNNMLECTMGVFILAAFRCLLNKEKIVLNHLIAGLLIALAFLCKGFFGLFLLAYPFFHWLVFSESNFKSTILRTGYLLLGTLGTLGIIILVSDAARVNLMTYLNHQVINSIDKVETVSSRWAIWRFFLESSAITLIVSIVLYFMANWKRKSELVQGIEQHKKKTYFLLLIVLSGILPIMISLKQRGFYIFAIYPFLCFAIALPLGPFLKSVLAKTNRLWNKRILYFGVILCITGITLSILSLGKIGRDKDLIHDIKTISTVVQKNQCIQIESPLRKNWSLRAYLQRYYDIGADSSPNSDCDYFLSGKSINQAKGFQPIELELKKFNLYIRTSSESN